MIRLSVPDLRGREMEYLARCIEDNWVSSAGPFVARLEAEMAECAGCQHAVAFVNGTAALHLALVAAGVRPGMHVIVPDFTFAATANAVYHAGARPLFADVAPDTWTLSPEALEQALAGARDQGLKIGAVISVHVMGQPADMEPLSYTCAKAGVPLIEDAAGAIGAIYKDKPVGCFGDIAMFSFNGNKTVTAGGGGMIVTNREDWAARVRHLSTQARAAAAYQYDEVGFNYRMTNLNAAVGLAQLERLPEMLATKKAHAFAYDRAVTGRVDMQPMSRVNWAVSSCWLYGLRTNSTAAAGSLVKHLDGCGIEARPFWKTLSNQKAYAAAARMPAPYAAGLSGRVVTIPSGSGLTESEREAVIKALAGWRGKVVND